MTISELGWQLAKGDLVGAELIRRIGFNAAMTSSFLPVASGQAYVPKKPADARELRVRAGGSANDDAAGTGARELTYEGIDENGLFVTEAVATAGASASSYTTTKFMRITRVFVSKSGTYADPPATNSHDLDILIEDSGLTLWAKITDSNIHRSVAHCATYVVPQGKVAYLIGLQVSADTGGAFECVFLHRKNIMEAAAPYSAMESFVEMNGMNGSQPYSFPVPHKMTAGEELIPYGKTSVAGPMSTCITVVEMPE